jgi:ribosome modulation factor
MLRTKSSNRCHYFRDPDTHCLCKKWHRDHALMATREARRATLHADCTECRKTLEAEAAAYLGIEAFEAGEPRKSCPHKLSTRVGQAWLYGWDEAKKHHETLEGLRPTE